MARMKDKNLFVAIFIACVLSLGTGAVQAEEEFFLEDDVEIEGLVNESPADGAAADATVDAEEELSLEDEDLDFGDEEEVSFDEFEEVPAEGGEELDLEPLKAEEEIPEGFDEMFPEEVAPEPVVEEALPAIEEPVLEAAPTPPPIIKEPVFEAQSSDQPDLNYEARLHDIFLNFHSSKTPDAEWMAILGGRQSESYQIQDRDNLWDISKTFFNDGNYWPKIWSMNRGIGNPHLIEPGNSIRFLLGTESEPPAFTVTENQTFEEEEQIAPYQPTEIELGDGSTVEIPPPLEETRPVLRKLPPSLPQWQGGLEPDVNYDDVGVQYGRRPILDAENTTDLSAYVSEKEAEFEGEIIEVEAGGQIAADLQYVYLKIKKGQGNTGERFLAIRNDGRLRRSTDEIDREDLGYRVSVLGEIVLEDIVQGRVGNEHELWRAMVRRSIDAVTKGSGVVRGKLIQIGLSDEGPRSNLVAQVIGGASDNRQSIFGEQSVVFLNRGSIDGVQEGQVLPIRSNQKLKNFRTVVEENVKPIGYLKVIRVTPRLATAVVLKSFDSIRAGDVTGQGSFLARGEQQTSALEAEESPTEDSDFEGSDFE